MNTLVQFTVVAGLSVAAAGATWFVNGKPSSLEHKVFECDRTLIEEDEICLADVPEEALWVDARSRSEWETDGLADSILWNLDPKEDNQAFEAGAAAVIFESGASLVVVYCGSEACGTSRSVAGRIRSLNLGPEVKVLKGGWDALRFKDSN